MLSFFFNSPMGVNSYYLRGTTVFRIKKRFLQDIVLRHGSMCSWIAALLPIRTLCLPTCSPSTDNCNAGSKVTFRNPRELTLYKNGLRA